MGRRTTKSKKKHKSKNYAGETGVRIKKKGGVTQVENEPTVTSGDEKENAAGASEAVQYTVDQLLEKAEEFVDTFQYDLAQRFCRRALECDSDNVRALETSGCLLLQLGQTENAQHCFGRAIELQPLTGHSKYMYMGQLMSGQEAVQCFEQGIRIMLQEIEKPSGKMTSDREDNNATPSGRDLSTAYCAVAEIYLTDECFQDDAEKRCRQSLDDALAADTTNPEVYHLMASFSLSRDDPQGAKESLDKGISLWLPQMRRLAAPEDDTSVAMDSAACSLFDVCPVDYLSRVNTTKMLIELSEYTCASDILELLLDEDDEVVEVWYLLGWLNYLQGNDYYGNARYYLKKMQKVAKKVGSEDQKMDEHSTELLKELGPGEDEDDDVEDSSAMGVDEWTDDDDEDDKTENTEETESSDKMQH